MEVSRKRSASLAVGVLILTAIEGPTGAAAVEVRRILARGADIPKLGRIAVPSSNVSSEGLDRACLGEDGAAVTVSRAEGGAFGLVCIDSAGPRAIVRAGDPAPEGGFFSQFYKCQFLGPNQVLFSAHRRVELSSVQGEYGVYRAGPSGIERVVGVADLSTDVSGELSPAPEISFAANHSGQLVVGLSTPLGTALFLLQGGAAPQRITANVGQFGLTNRGDVVVTGETVDNTKDVVAWYDGAAHVLAQERDEGSSGVVYQGFELREVHDDTVVFMGLNYDSVASELLLYDAATRTVRPLAPGEGDALASAAAERERGKVDAENADDDVSLLAYNQAGNALLSVEDPGPLDLLLTGPAAASVSCPPNDRLSDTVPVPWTPVPTATAIPTPTPVPVDPIELEAQGVSGELGDQVDLRVVLHAHDWKVAGVQIDIQAAPPITIAVNADGKPDCWRNPEIDKDFTVYSFVTPSQPSIPEGAVQMRSLILSLTNVDPIPDESLLFTCRLTIAADATPGRYPLELLGLGGSTPDGKEIDAIGRDGVVTVTDPSARALEPVTDGLAASDGCSMAAHSSDWSAMLILLPGVFLLVKRRRAALSALAPPLCLPRVAGEKRDRDSIQ